MSGQVDFHIHSNRSCDGDFSPAELVGMAREKGLRAMSIADHDTVAAYPEAVQLAEGSGVEMIPGIEVTTLFGGREFHLLLPFVDWTRPAIAGVIDSQTRCRMDEARERVEKARKLGFALSWDEVREKSNGAAPLGVKIAQILLENRENESNPALEFFYRKKNRAIAPYLFYKEYFAEGKAAFVPKKYIELLDVLEMAPGTGGVPVLAHPGAYFQQTTGEDARFLKERGLIGMEVYTFYHAPEQTAYYRGVAEELDLVPTAGSDFHGRIKPHVAFGALREGDYGMVERLRDRKGRKG